MGQQRTGQGGQQSSPLRSDRGNTIISNAVVSQVAGIAAQEIEKVQMGGGATAAVGGFLQSVTGGSSGRPNYGRGVSVEVGDRKRVGEGKRVDLGGGRIIKKKKNMYYSSLT